MKAKPKFKQTEIGMIPEDWEVKELGNVCEIRRGASPRPIQNYISNSGLPWIKIADATSQNTRFIEWTNEFIKKEGEKSTVLVEPGDLILSNSATPGIPKIVKIHAGIHDGWLLISNFRGIIKDFMYYLFLSEREKLVNFASGTIFKNLKTEIVKNYKISLPPLPEQRAIAKVLSAFDDKIELNQRMNKTLEAIGQAIFKQWFVDFEFPNEEGKPYKSSGGEMVYNEELGKELPKGWRVGRLGEIGNFKNGINYLRDEKGDTEFFIVNVRDIANNKFLLKEQLDKINIDYKKAQEYLLSSQDIIIARSADPGKVSLIVNDTSNLIFSGFSIRLRLHNPNNQLYFFFLLQNLKQQLANFSIGTTLTSVNQETLKNMPIILPSETVLSNFNKIIEIFFNRIAYNLNQSLTLPSLRDSLLPKLMSGKIRVPVEVRT